GDTITFTLTLSNGGPDAATNVDVSDLLPAGLAFVSAPPSLGSCDGASGDWTLDSVANGDSATLTITAAVVSPKPQTSTATVSYSDQNDPTTPDTASIVATPQQVELALTQAISDVSPNVGDTITLTTALSNAGPDSATNVNVADLLPAGL